MKLLFTLLLSFFVFSCYSQNRQIDEESFRYTVNGASQFYIYKTTPGTSGGVTESFLPEFKFAAQGFKFFRGSVVNHSGGFNAVLIQFEDIIHDPNNPKKKIIDPYDGSPLYINNKNNGQLFWLKEDDFNDYLTKGTIIKRYSILPTFTYGASLALPFKMRSETGEQPMRITPEITLGGYFGPRFRLNRYKSIFLSIPLTLGVTTIGINENNTIKETTPGEDILQDALVVGRTFSTGAVLEYQGFQIGAIMGWDKAGGDLGKQWVYNDRLWYSFSIGFAFFNRTTGNQK